MKSFEERLKALEDLAARVKNADVPLEAALAAYEEGIKIASSLEKDLEKIENKIEILANGIEDGPKEEPRIELFS
jgi:exodeoxyribonuclease VII small subunit